MSVILDPIYLPALKGRIGRWAFYTVLMKFREVAERIHLSDEIYQNKRLSDMVQRTIQKSRVGVIANYLIVEKERFFPAMVVAVFDGEPNWIEFSVKKHSENLDLNLSGLDVSKLDSFGLLALRGDETLFPLDGQHRLAGIRRALTDPEADQSFLGDDEIAVMLVAHEHSDLGRTRSRRLFTVLNKRAVPVKKHETIALDEDDVMAIATRHLVERYEPLSQEGVVLFQTNASIPRDNCSAFTTIVTIYDMLFDLFTALAKRKAVALKFNRPNDDWLEVYLKCAEHFYSEMMRTFRDVGECLTNQSLSGVIAKNRREDGGHVLFRPVGQRLIAQLVARVVTDGSQEKFEDPNVDPGRVKELACVALTNGFQTFSTLPTDLASKPYARLIWEPETGKMRVGRAALLRDVILRRYKLLRGASEKSLRRRLKSSLGEEYEVGDFYW